MKATRSMIVKVCTIMLFSATVICAGEAATSPDRPTDASQFWETGRQRSEIYADCAHNAWSILQGWIQHKRDPKTQPYSKKS